MRGGHRIKSEGFRRVSVKKGRVIDGIVGIGRFPRTDKTAPHLWTLRGGAKRRGFPDLQNPVISTLPTGSETRKKCRICFTPLFFFFATVATVCEGSREGFGRVTRVSDRGRWVGSIDGSDRIEGSDRFEGLGKNFLPSDIIRPLPSNPSPRSILDLKGVRSYPFDPLPIIYWHFTFFKKSFHSTRNFFFEKIY